MGFEGGAIPTCTAPCVPLRRRGSERAAIAEIFERLPHAEVTAAVLVGFDANDGEVINVVLDGRRAFLGTQPDAERPAMVVLATDQFGAARLPYRQRRGAEPSSCRVHFRICLSAWTYETFLSVVGQ